jgi:hypothetical protein
MSDTAIENSGTHRFVTGAPGRFLMFSVAWYVVFLLLPEELAGIWYLMYGVTTLVIVGRHLRTQAPRIRRATSMILGAGVLSLSGALVRGAHALISGTDNPFPSPAEFFSLTGYLLLIAAIFYIVRQRSPRLGLDPILDAIVGGMAAAVLQWTLVLIPYLQGSGG